MVSLQTERIDEEVKVRLSFEDKMNKAEDKRKERVMDEVIRSALVEVGAQPAVLFSSACL